MPDSPSPSGQDNRKPVLAAMQLVFEIGYIIAIPAFLLGFGGAYLDRYTGTSPLFLGIGLLLALCASGYAVYGLVKRVTEQGVRPPKDPS